MEREGRGEEGLLLALLLLTSVFDALGDREGLSGVERHRPVDGVGRADGALRAAHPGRLRGGLYNRFAEIVLATKEKTRSHVRIANVPPQCRPQI